MNFRPFLVLAVVGCLTSNAVADDRDVAEIYGDEVIPPKVTFARTPRSLSEVAENVTVITHDEISKLQAKSLDDLLHYFTGVIPYPNRMPSDLSVAMVQGLPNRQCLITLDGVPLNNLGDGVVDIGFFSIAFLDRIEIVKGPSASAWGRSVGAVINLVTKDPTPDRYISGEANAYWGERDSNGQRLNVNGTVEETGTGYSFAAARYSSDGWTKHVSVDRESVYGRLTQQLGQKNKLTLIYAKSDADRNILYVPVPSNIQADNHAGSRIAIARVNTQISGTQELETTLHYYKLDVTNNFQNISPILPFIPVGGVQVQKIGLQEELAGLQVAYKLNTESYWLTLGFDGLTGRLDNSDFSLAPPVNSTSISHPTILGAYLTGGWKIWEPLTVTASGRYDYSSKSKDTWTPTLGLIYTLEEKTFLRASFGYGHSLPTLGKATTSDPETLWRAQVGVETNHIPGLWWKTNVFYDRTSNIKLSLLFFDTTPPTTHNLVRQGVETELKTSPILNTSFGVGYTYLDIYDRDTGATIKGLPKNHVVISANFKTAWTDILLAGKYIDWNSPATSDADAVIWNLLVDQKLYQYRDYSAHAQFAVYNLFDGKQYPNPVFSNIPRTVTGGIKVVF